MRTFIRFAVVVASLAWPLESHSQGRGEGVPEFWVRPGYRVDLVADDLDEARFIEFGDNGALFLSQPKAGSILMLRDGNGDGVYEQRTKFLTDRPSVHGMHYKDGWLWFTQAQTGEGGRARDTNGDGQAEEIENIFPPGSIPAGGGHPYRAILVGEDSVYISVSDPTNMQAEDTDRKKIYRYNLDGSNRREFSSGIRNNEKLRFRPGTNEVWGVDHGSDWFGKPMGENNKRQPITDTNPPEELNHYVEGGFYGHPFLVGNRVPRLEYLEREDLLDLAAKTTVPALNLPAHWAGNGFTFLTKDHFPDHQGGMFIAFHGSWNRSVKGGYCIQRVLFDEVTGEPFGSLTVVRCITEESKVLARPTDCAEAPDGSVLFSCDQTRRIYRISRQVQ